MPSEQQVAIVLRPARLMSSIESKWHCYLLFICLVAILGAKIIYCCLPVVHVISKYAEG
jgi:hypothetical protein